MAFFHKTQTLTDKFINVSTNKTPEHRDLDFENFAAEQKQLVAELEAELKNGSKTTEPKPKNILTLRYPEATISEYRIIYRDLDAEKAGLRGRRKAIKAGLNPDPKLAETPVEKTYKVVHPANVVVQVIPEGVSGK